MSRFVFACIGVLLTSASLARSETNSATVVSNSLQYLERTCFQTGRPFSPRVDLGSDVAIVYGIDRSLPERIQTWRDKGYRIHVMTGVAWGNYQDYLYGKWDGTNHEDEAQTVGGGQKIGHGGDVYYMSPSESYGKYLCVGVQRALDAGAEAIHLEEPEFWVNGGYSEGFKREWKSYYGEDWQNPESSEDAQWRSSKLKYFLYRRALQQVFNYVQNFNHAHNRNVRCYVPTHSLLNYAHWHIVSPESSLAMLKGCDGYIAQVWTGTARTPNMFRGELRERTFETAFLEYGAMQNLVRSTGRRVWYLNDPIEDNPSHDWTDYRQNWESTLVASLFQPEVSHYEVAPWPERIFNGRYPRRNSSKPSKPIPPEYATELQTVMNTLNDMKQRDVVWDSGTPGMGVVVSDSLMFERGKPHSSDEHMSHIYGLALPLLKRGMPVTPVQLENVTIPRYLSGFRVLLLTYDGMKPLSPEVHTGIAQWVRDGGSLIVCDDDADPYNKVREWWNTGDKHYATPREHLFEMLGLDDAKTNWSDANTIASVGRGSVTWMHASPVAFASDSGAEGLFIDRLKKVLSRAKHEWRETNYLMLRRGPYIIAAGLDETTGGSSKTLRGHFVNLFDSQLLVQPLITIVPGSRSLLLDLDAVPKRQPAILAAACKTLPAKAAKGGFAFTAEGVENTPAVVLIRCDKPPKSINIDGELQADFNYSPHDQLLWLRFENLSRQRVCEIQF